MMNERRENEMSMEVEDITQEPVQEEQVERRTEQRAPADQAPTDPISETLESLFEGDQAKRFRSRWLTIQSKFVDDPRDSVKQADDLVADIIKNVSMSFSSRRVGLEKQWNSGENVSTEDMRQALKRYRSFFDRLLSLES